MRDSDTSLAAGRRDFTQTAWSSLLLGRHATPEERHIQLERLARRYWKPVYSYIRVRWNRSNEDAKDLTQQFFLWILRSDFLSKVRSDRGRFRKFVKTALERFVLGEYDAAHRLKRGGGVEHARFDFMREIGAEPPSPESDPEGVLKREWRRVLIAEALVRLGNYYRSEAKEVHYRLFEDFYFAPEPGPSYDELATRHGLSRVDIANYLARARSKFRGFIEDVLAEGVASADELREEFDELFGKD